MARNIVEVEFRVSGDGLNQLVAASTATKAAAADASSLAASVGAIGSKGLTGLEDITAQFADMKAKLAAAAETAAETAQITGGLGSSFNSAAVGAGAMGAVLLVAIVQLAALKAAATAVINTLVELSQEGLAAASELERANAGLSRAALFRGLEPAAASQAVQGIDLVKNGLLSLSQASEALGNLLASGFSLQDSITLLKRYGDAAAFAGTPAALLGDTVVASTAKIESNAKATADAGARVRLYADEMERTRISVGAAAELSGTYEGKLQEITGTSEKLIERYGELILHNQALDNVLNFLVRTVEFADANFDTWASGLSIFLPIVQLLTAALSGLILVLASIANIAASTATAFGLMVEGVALLTVNVDLLVKGQNLRKFGDDLRKVALDASQTALSLPGDVARIRKAVADAQGGDGFDNRGGQVQTGGLQGNNVISVTLGIITDALKPTVDAFLTAYAAEQKRVSEGIQKINREFDESFRGIADQREQLLLEVAALPDFTGKTTPQQDLDKKLGQIQIETEKRIGEERKLLDRLNEEAKRQKLPDQTEKLDAVFEFFKKQANENQRIQEGLARNDFTRKTFEELTQINDVIFQAQGEIAADNPYVKIFSDADRALDQFMISTRDNIDLQQQGVDVLNQLESKRIQKADVANANEIFSLREQLRQFREKAGLDSALTGSDLANQLFEQANQLRLIGDEGAKAASKLILEAVNSGRIDASALNGGQVELVQNLITNQIQEAQAQKTAAAAQAEKDRIERKNLVDRQTVALDLNREALDKNAAAQIANTDQLANTNLAGTITVVAGPETTVDAVPTGGNVP